MKLEAAMQIVTEMKQRYLDAPDPGDSKESIGFFEAKANALNLAIPFELETSSMLHWARIFYSSRKWEQYPHIGNTFYQAIAAVGRRVKLAPPTCFDSDLE